MQLIDEDGNLLGVVNVIDALVVLVLLAVLVAGVALVSSGGGGGNGSGDSEQSDDEQLTRYVTLELGAQPNYVVDELDNGTAGTVGGTDETLTVTDVAVNGSAVTVRGEVNGTVLDDELDRETLQVAGEPLRLGRSIGLDMGTYTTNGTVTAIGDDPALPIAETETTVDVELRNVSPTVGDGLEEGMVVTARGDTVATLESLEREPATVVLRSDDGEIHEREHPRNEDVTLTVDVRALETEDGIYYQGQQLGIGEDVVLRFDRSTVAGTVTRVD